MTTHGRTRGDRDYVVRAFNADKPYDQFVREQIAGDELKPNDPDHLSPPVPAWARGNTRQ